MGLDSEVIGERLESHAAVVAGLSSPHDDSYLDLLETITDEERQEAHEREIKQLVDFEVYEEIDRDTLEGKHKIITTTWVDKRKSTTVKSRLCAREYNVKGDVRDDTFASTPTSVACRVVDLVASSKGHKTMAGDVSAAFLHAKVPDDMLILISPPGDYVSKKYQRPLWRLKRWLYGLRGSPAAWQHHVAGLLCSFTFHRCLFEPNLYYSKELACWS